MKKDDGVLMNLLVNIMPINLNVCGALMETFTVGKCLVLMLSQ